MHDCILIMTFVTLMTELIIVTAHSAIRISQQRLGLRRHGVVIWRVARAWHVCCWRCVIYTGGPADVFQFFCGDIVHCILRISASQRDVCV